MPIPASFALSLFYLTSFAVLGAYLPYFNLYLDRSGFTGLQLGMISALLPLSQVVAPMAGGMLADRSGRRRDLVILSSFLGLGAFSLILRVGTFAGIAAVVAGFALLRASALPLVDATAMEFSEAGGTPYGRMRVWGSAAFITVALAAGWLVGRSGERSILGLLIALLAANALAAVVLPRDSARPSRDAAAAPFGGMVRRPAVLLFLAACLLSQAAHGPYYVFYSVHLEREGFAPASIGLLWALAVACEVVAMLSMPAILKRSGGTLQTMLACLGVSALRWVVLARGGSPAVLAAAQALHAASFAAFHVAAVTHTHRLFGRDRGGSGQALYSASTYGLGNAVGMLGSGLLAEVIGIRGLFAAAAAVALLGALAAVAAMRREAAGRPGPNGATPPPGPDGATPRRQSPPFSI